MSEGFLLDTNVVSELTRPAPNSRVRAWIASHEPLHISVISIGELRRGFSLLSHGKRRTELEHWFERFLMPLFATRILPVTQDVAERWGLLGAEGQQRGKALELADGLIAATALEHNLTRVTRNVKDFAGLGVTLLNLWESN